MPTGITTHKYASDRSGRHICSSPSVIEVEGNGRSIAAKEIAPMSTLAASEAQATPVRALSLTWTLSIAYWTFTLIVALELVFGSMWMLLRSEGARWVMTHLGYPLYVNYIIGVWKLPGAVALLVPGFERPKEWAYAGAVINLESSRNPGVSPTSCCKIRETAAGFRTKPRRPQRKAQCFSGRFSR
jgi:hypothetical protein